MNVLLISNGHGEDVMAAEVGRVLGDLGCTLRAVPMIGLGLAYDRWGIEVFGPRRELPSGGYTLRSPRRLVQDLASGLLPTTVDVWRTIARQSRSVDAAFVVGDVYAVSATARFSPLPRTYLPSAVSVMAWPDRVAPWQEPYGPLERRLMRRSQRVYARDGASATWLQEHGVSNAVDLGNPMLDAVNGRAPIEHEGPYLVLLPGTREDRWFSLPRMLDAAFALADVPFHAVVAWAGADAPPSVPGWRYHASSRVTGTVGSYERDGYAVSVARDAFGTLLEEARVAMSTSGTAAEQCAGLGIPLVAFATNGPQYTSAFANGQKRALGAALEVTARAPEAIASAVRMLNADVHRRAKAREDGRRAMGTVGASQRIAADVVRALQGSTSATMPRS